MIGANLLTKATNLFMKEVSAKGGKIRKADEPMEAAPVPDGAGQPDEDALIQECIESLDKGELTADPEKVAEWAKSKGMSEESAADFAEAVLSAYFDEGEAEEMPTEEGKDKMPETETMEETAKAISFWAKAIDKKLKRIEHIESNLENIVKGMTVMIQSNSELTESNKVMKASLEKLGVIPAGKPAAIQKSASPIKGDEMTFGDTKKVILKGAMAGVLNPAEVAAWESTFGRIVSDNIKKYIQENK